MNDTEVRNPYHLTWQSAPVSARPRFFAWSVIGLVGLTSTAASALFLSISGFYYIRLIYNISASRERLLSSGAAPNVA